MASDWIKMRTDLYRDPKVCQIADILSEPDSDLSSYVYQHCQCNMTVTRNVMRNVTVGALVSVWGVCRQQGRREGSDLTIPNASLSVIDDIAEIPGFGEAMALVGWLVEDANALIFPRFFDEWNVDPTDRSKEMNAARQRRHRAKSNVTCNVTDNVTVTTRGRDRDRERDNTPLEDKGDGDIPGNTIRENPPQACARPSVTVETVAEEFCFSCAGAINSKERDLKTVVDEFREWVRTGIVTLDQLRSRISDGSRDRTEKLWQFKKFFEDQKNGHQGAGRSGSNVGLNSRPGLSEQQRDAIARKTIRPSA